MNAQSDQAVTWHGNAVPVCLPEWLPISLVDDWFGRKLADPHQDNSTKALCTNFGIQEFSEKVIFHALISAINRYWDDGGDHFEQFVDLLLARDWHECFERPPPGLKRCPILADIEGGQMAQPVEAGKAYFGPAWGEKSIAELYKGVEGVAWARRDHENAKHRKILEWLGVVKFPRVLPGATDSSDEESRIRTHLPHGSNPCTTPRPTLLDALDPASLTRRQTILLLQILALNWDLYYRSKSEIQISCCGPSPDQPVRERLQRSNGFPFGDGGYGVQPTRRLNQPRVEIRGATGSRWFLGVPHASVGEGLTQPMDRSPLPRTGPWRLRHPLESPLTGRRTGRRPASIPMDAGAGPDAPAWARAGSWSEPLMVLGCGIGQRSRIDGGPSAARRGLRFQSLAGEVGGPVRRHISFKSMIYCVLRIP